MSDDVLITPASRKIEFFDNGGNIDGKIELDASGNLNITSAGSIGIGDITQDIHIGDGTQAVDLVFDFTSSIYSVANQDLTIGKKSLGGNDIIIDTPTNLVVNTDSGNIEIGPKNTSFCHVLSDRSKFYFNKPLIIDGGNTNGDAYLISSYNTEDFVIATNNGTEDRITIKQATGNVGIGTTSPASLLDVASASTSVIRLSNTDTALTEDQITGEIIFDQSDATSGGDGISGRIGMRSAVRPDNGSYFGNVADMGFFVSGATDGTASNNAALEAMTIKAGGNVGIGTTNPTFVSGSGLHIKNSSQANVRLEDEAGEFFDVAMQNGDAYLINRVSDGLISLRTNSTERLKIASGGGITFNQAYTFPTSDGSANQVLQTDGNGALSFATVSGGSDTNTFVITGEESDLYAGTGSTGNANGYQFSYGNGRVNVTNSSTGTDFGINVPVNCTLTRIDVVFGNNGNVSTGTTTFVVVKNGTNQTGDLSTNHSSGVHDTHHTGLSHSFSAGDRFNLRTTTPSKQVGPMRMTAYFTPT